MKNLILNTIDMLYLQNYSLKPFSADVSRINHTYISFILAFHILSEIQMACLHPNPITAVNKLYLVGKTDVVVAMLVSAELLDHLNEKY